MTRIDKIENVFELEPALCQPRQTRANCHLRRMPVWLWKNRRRSHRRSSRGTHQPSHWCRDDRRRLLPVPMRRGRISQATKQLLRLLRHRHWLPRRWKLDRDGCPGHSILQTGSCCRTEYEALTMPSLTKIQCQPALS